MRILTTSGTRSFNVVLRQLATGNDYDVVLYNENTGGVSTVTVTSTNQQIIDNMDQLQVTITSDFNEGDEYSFYIVENGESVILHRNKLFFTDKTPQNYSL